MPRRRERASPSSTLRQAALVAALALLFGGWWWIRNVVAYGTPQPGVRLRERVPGVEHDVLRFAGDFGERLVKSFWGWFGWFEAHLPLALSAALTVVVVVTVAAACWRHLPRVVLVLPAVVDEIPAHPLVHALDAGALAADPMLAHRTMRAQIPARCGVAKELPVAVIVLPPAHATSTSTPRA